MDEYYNGWVSFFIILPVSVADSLVSATDDWGVIQMGSPQDLCCYHSLPYGNISTTKYLND